MAIQIIKTNEPKPPRIVVYGGAGCGKTTFAASADNPIFLCTEDGLGKLTVDHFPLITSFEELLADLEILATQKHDYKTVVLDSLDWLEGMIWTKVAADHGKTSIEDIGFAKGYIFALNYWREILAGFNYLRTEKGMIPILIAHSTVKRFDSPITEPYDRYGMKLHDKAKAVIEEWADVVAYAGYKVVTKTDKKGTTEHTRGIGKGERALFTCEMPAYSAKNRYDLPPELPLVWEHFAEALFA